MKKIDSKHKHTKMDGYKERQVPGKGLHGVDVAPELERFEAACRGGVGGDKVQAEVYLPMALQQGSSTGAFRD